MAYATIFISSDLPEDVRRRYRKEMPGRYSRADQQALLRSASFARIEETDVTQEYLRVLRALHAANERHRDALRRVFGGADFTRRQARREAAIAAIGQGVLRRSLFVAERAP